MNSYVTGMTIKALREKQGITQAALGDRIGVSSKTVSKWETARGLPDIALLQPLAQALGVSVVELMDGECVINQNRCSNMARAKLYVCPLCGNAIHSIGNTFVSCCGITLPALEAEKADDEHILTIEPTEDEHFLTIRHPMTKEHYISFFGLGDGRPHPNGQVLSGGKRRDPHAASWTRNDLLVLQSSWAVQKETLIPQKEKSLFCLHGKAGFCVYSLQCVNGRIRCEMQTPPVFLKNAGGVLLCMVNLGRRRFSAGKILFFCVGIAATHIFTYALYHTAHQLGLIIIRYQQAIFLWVGHIAQLQHQAGHG